METLDETEKVLQLTAEIVKRTIFIQAHISKLECLLSEMRLSGNASILNKMKHYGDLLKIDVKTTLETAKELLEEEISDARRKITMGIVDQINKNAHNSLIMMELAKEVKQKKRKIRMLHD